MKHPKEFHNFISLMVTFACLSFVLYQSHECWLKYYTLPKSTDVSIQKAESYPEVTLCPKDLKAASLTVANASSRISSSVEPSDSLDLKISV